MIALALGGLCVLFVGVIGTAVLCRRRLGPNQLPQSGVDEIEAELQQILAEERAYATRPGVGV